MNLTVVMTSAADCVDFVCKDKLYNAFPWLFFIIMKWAEQQDDVVDFIAAPDEWDVFSNLWIGH